MKNPYEYWDKCKVQLGKKIALIVIQVKKSVKQIKTKMGNIQHPSVVEEGKSMSNRKIGISTEACELGDSTMVPSQLDKSNP